MDDFAKTLLYCEVPAYYIFKNSRFERRKRGVDVNGWPGDKKEHALGRVYTIHPNNSECYHLRLLLHEIRGPTSFEALKTVNGVVQPSFKIACLALGLLEDDRHWRAALEEAALCQSPFMMRELFTIMLVFCQMSDPVSLWDTFKRDLSEDFKRQIERQIEGGGEHLMKEVFNKCLLAIEEAYLALGGNNIEEYGLPKPSKSDVVESELGIYASEINYDVCSLERVVESNENLLTDEQKSVYYEIISSLNMEEGKIYFLDAPGGTGKTFLINLILSKVRSTRDIEIAATLLQGGRTAHSALKLPLNLTSIETPMCNIPKQSKLAEVLRKTKIIVWDESTMAHKRGIEALDRTLQDIRNKQTLMGGMTVLLAGDFRQTLPVVPKGTRADEIKACLKKSTLWPRVKILKLCKNMRVHLKGEVSAGQFSELLLKLGNGKFPEADGKISIPSELCTTVTKIKELIEKIYPDVAHIKDKPLAWLRERAVLTPKMTRPQ
ncbi:hypothetical protein MSG28_000709 [Choristoneura fumiferana]|uniref:Uncharacterized protein n=1 Tax=Choristoneura fumiferana TaxID=7141 RepID=A0ACC0K1V8_CHOFU|nr:hypothetical protein MSG28_000709 [Choristoneura fumiferana]